MSSVEEHVSIFLKNGRLLKAKNGGALETFTRLSTNKTLTDAVFVHARVLIHYPSISGSVHRTFIYALL